MEAIVLAGGFGTRLREIVQDVPKPMADIAGRPFLSYVLDLLARQGVTRVLLSVGYKHEVIVRHFGQRYRGMDIEYVVESEPLGTGGAIREALGRCRCDDVLVLNGDTYFAVDLRTMLAFHAGKHADLTIALRQMASAERYGSVVLGPDDRIAGFREKTDRASGYINGGVYVVNRRTGGMLSGLGEAFSFEQDFLQPNIGRLGTYGFASNAPFIDIGVPTDYAKARTMLGNSGQESTP